MTAVISVWIFEGRHRLMDILSKGMQIILNNRNKLYKKEFVIEKVQGQGQSMIAYEAIADGKRGLLKELAPQNEGLLFERVNHQLVASGEASAHKLENLKKQFFEKMEKIDHIRSQNPLMKVLNNYFPDYELFEGDDREDQVGTAYYWVPYDPRGQVYTHYLKSHKDNSDLDYVAQVLTIVKSLSDCVKMIHQQGFLHLDLKPDNFLVRTNSNNEADGSIYLFDLSSLYDMSDDNAKVSGTPGYVAPEIEKYHLDPDCSSDIYSLGVILYNSLMDISDHAYTYEDYDTLYEKVKNSPLLSAKRGHSYLKLQEVILRLLEKTLNLYQEQRYSCAEDLIKDLDQAIASVDDVKYQSEEEYQQADLRSVMGSYLYQHPLDQYVNKDEELRLYLIGDSPDLGAFMDMALQAGQMANHRLQIFMIGQFDMDAYLDQRSFLKEILHFASKLDFMNNKDKYKQLKKSTYADIIVKSKHDEQSIIEKMVSKYPPHYIVVGYNEDAVSYKAATNVQTRLKQDAYLCMLSYAHLKKKKQAPDSQLFDQLEINKETLSQSFDSDLLRMALNLHMTWNMGKNNQQGQIMKDFNDPYNRASSIASALTIPYKLRSIGLEMNDLDALQTLVKTIDDPNMKMDKQIKKLIQLEHRRWVLEKAIDGYRPPENRDGYYDDETYKTFVKKLDVKDRQKHLHGCMVNSTKKMPLLDYQADDWNKQIEKDSLDPLDTLSVKFYQAICHKIDEDPLDVHDNEYVKLIDKQLTDQAKNQFAALCYCMNQICQESMAHPVYTKQYGQYVQAFKDSLKGQDYEDQVLNLYQNIDKKMKLYLKRNKPVDYKKLDVDIIRNLPFIISNRPFPSLTLALETKGNATQLYKNVASATVLLPKSIDYLCEADFAHVNDVDSTMNKIMNYLESLQVDSKVHVQIKTCDPKCREAFEKDLQSNIKYTYDFVEAFDLSVNEDTLYDLSTSLYHSIYKDSQWLKSLEEKDIPLFEYDAATQLFHPIQGCEYLTYNIYHPELRLKDVLSMNALLRMDYLSPTLANVYQQLWTIYTGLKDEQKLDDLYSKDQATKEKAINKYKESVANYMATCEYLRDAYSLCNRVGVFMIDSNRNGNKEYDLTSDSKPIFMRLCEMLYEAFPETFSFTEKSQKGYTHKICIHAEESFLTVLNKAYDKIKDPSNTWTDPDLLVSEELLTSAGKRLEVYYHGRDLQCDLSRIPKKNEEGVKQVLNRLKQNGFLNQYSKSNNFISFKFASPELIDVLTKKGEILEVYTYYKCKEMNYFDDLSSSITFKIKDADVMNEMDCLMTKGQRTIFVECKSTEKLEQDYYFKLKYLADAYGVEPIPVLVSNQYKFEEKQVENERQETRGNTMGIMTISDPKKIMHIGETIKNIIENS